MPASEFLHSCSYADGTPDGIIDVWTDSLIGGVTALAGRWGVIGHDDGKTVWASVATGGWER